MSVDGRSDKSCGITDLLLMVVSVSGGRSDEPAQQISLSCCDEHAVSTHQHAHTSTC